MLPKSSRFSSDPELSPSATFESLHNPNCKETKPKAATSPIAMKAANSSTADGVFNIHAWQIGDRKRDDISLRGTCFEEYWDSLSEESEVDETSATKIVLRVNGHAFRGRMRLLQLLMFSLDDAPLWERHTVSYPCREWHWLWGYACQLDWQHRSGRLAYGNENGEEMSPNSWWNYMNFGFSVAIFVAANNTGLLNEAFGGRSVSVELDERSKTLLENDAAIQSCVEAWESLFRDGYRDFKDCVVDNGSKLSDRSFRQHRFRFGQQNWNAHTDVIQLASTSDSAKQLLSLLPVPEQKFATGWGHFVEVLAAATFPTDLISLVQDGAGFLPLQVITDALLSRWKAAAAAKSLQSHERRHAKVVKTTHEVANVSSSQLAKMRSFFGRVARTESVSRSMPSTFNKLSHGSIWVKIAQMVRIVFLAILPRRRHEGPTSFE